jgi:hypothetical protein
MNHVKLVGEVLVAVLLLGSQAIAQTSEAVKVHGQWTIDVRTRDGGLVSHQEFENALLPATNQSVSGHTIMARILGRQLAVPRWLVVLGSGSLADPPPCGSANVHAFLDGVYGAGQQNGCLLLENTAQNILTASVVGSTLVLAGTATADQTSRIKQVMTTLVSPDFFFIPFSGTVLPTAVDVVPGQLIQVKVVLSFQ